MEDNKAIRSDHLLRCSGYELIKTGIARAHGSYLYDVNGKRYVDFEAGVWCAALGHNHWRVNQAIRSQLDKISHVGYRYTNDVVEQAADMVLRTLPSILERIIFLSSGSEAVELGVQIARRLSGRPLLLTMSDSYLAAYGSAGRKNPDTWYCFDWTACVGCQHAEECDPECVHLRNVPFELIGGMIFEPGNSSGLVRFPPKQLVQALIRKIKGQDGLLVVDEVTTGMGRTGVWYGFQHYGLTPDIVALGKGIGNGFPVSAVALTDEIAARLESDAFRYAQSHQNDPLGCAVARAVVSALAAEGLIERSNSLGARLLRELQALAQHFGTVKEARGRGLMIALEFQNSARGMSAAAAFSRLFECGFVVGCKPAANTLRFYPPLTIGEQDINALVGNLQGILTGAE
jgi:acetylornithine/N-succinyldiaminopimelate aminotransferase